MAYLCFYSAEGRGWGGGGEKVKQYLQLSCFQRGKRNRVHGEMQRAGGGWAREAWGEVGEEAARGLPPSGCLAWPWGPGRETGRGGGAPGVASPLQALMGSLGLRGSLCPVTPARKRRGVPRPLRGWLRHSPSLVLASPVLCTAAGHSFGQSCPCGVPCRVSGVPSLGGARLGQVGRDLGQSRPVAVAAADSSLPLSLASPPSPRAHRRGKLGAFGLGRGRGHGEGRDQAEPLRATCPGRAAGH